MLVKVAVQRHAVALVQQVLQGVHALHAQGPLDPVLQVGVIKDDAESKGLGSNSDRLPRATCAERERPGERGLPRATCAGVGSVLGDPEPARLLPTGAKESRATAATLSALGVLQCSDGWARTTGIVSITKFLFAERERDHHSGTGDAREL